MDLAAPHTGFVAAAYVLSALVLIVLATVVLLRDRKLRAEAESLDNRRKKDVP